MMQSRGSLHARKSNNVIDISLANNNNNDNKLPKNLKPTKNKRPPSSSFHQQTLPAWQPLLTVRTVLPTFFAIGITFVPIGVILLISSNQVQEHVIDYTNCNQTENTKRCADVIDPPSGGSRGDVKCHCKINFTLNENFRANVFIYYGLTNYYQNHRRYVRSRDDRQLRGKVVKPSKNCEPLAQVNINGEFKQISPCGAIANSIFNDKIVIKRYIANSNIEPVPISFKNIAWPTDREAKFGKLSPKELDEKYVKPINWKEWLPGGLQNESLMVWMRTAALPNFRKLYARVEHNQSTEYERHLPQGQYLLEIEYNYPVEKFKGTKRVIISNTSWIGGRNPFLGICYIVVGTICLILTAFFYYVHKNHGKSTPEIIHINQRTPYHG